MSAGQTALELDRPPHLRLEDGSGQGVVLDGRILEDDSCQHEMDFGVLDEEGSSFRQNRGWLRRVGSTSRSTDSWSHPLEA